MHGQDVSSMFTTRSALTPWVLMSQLDEQPVRVGVLLLRAVELFHALGGRLVAQAHATQESLHPTSAGTDVQSLGFDLIVTALRHRTSITRMMWSLSRVMSARDSKVFLPSGAARGALRFQWSGVFRLILSNIPGHSHWTSHKHRCMLHRRSVFRWSNMSRNQSRTMGSAWGVLPCCRWARLQRLQGLEWPGRPGRHRECCCGRSPRV